MIGNDDETNEGVNSGLEGQEDDAPCSGHAGSSESDDDGPLIISRKKTYSKFLNDSDEESGADTAAVAPDSPVEECEERPLASIRHSAKKSRRVILHSDDSDDSDLEPNPSRVSNLKSNELSSEDDKNIPFVSPFGKGGKGMPLDDLFDAEMDSDDNNSTHSANRDNGDQDSDNADNDEAVEMSAALKRRLKKGAAKKDGKSSRPQKPKASDVLQMRSESQRMLREGAVKMPYHQPQKMDLSAILNRTAQKQQQLQCGRNIGAMSWKHAPVPEPIQKRKHKHKGSSPKVPVPSSISTPVDAAILTGKLGDLQDEDDLPDLATRVCGNMSQSTTTCDDITTADKESGEAIMLETDDVCDSKEKAVTKKVNDSGYVTTPAQSSEEENSADSKEVCDAKEKVPLTDCEDIAGSQEDTQISQRILPVMYPPPKETLLTPKLAVLKIDTFAPKLSGSADNFVDLDEDDDLTAQDETPRMPRGVEKLMSRVCQHSKRSGVKKAQEVEIRTVCKDQVEGREELVLEKITYHLDEKEEGLDPELNKPGAKLVKLKEKLINKMREKREMALQKRVELYDIENEGGRYQRMEDEAAEEAELTDQTDTDGEGEEDEQGFDEEEEELDADYVPGMEDDDVEPNPFVDAEADDDDGDDEIDDDVEDDLMDEGCLHLELDTRDEGDSDSESQTAKPELQKKKTLELFDEDANTESPKLSSNRIEISERPFEQLSGNSRKSSGECLVDLSSEETEREPIKELVKEDTNISMFSTKDRDTSYNSADSSFELIGSLIPAGQRPSKKFYHRESKTPDLFTPSTKSSLTNDQSLRRSVMQLDDSQDVSAGDLSLPADSTPRISQSFSFGEDTHSQMLDEDGLLRVKSTGKKATRRQLMMESISQGVNDDLLALCSGKFQESQRSSSKSLFPKEIESTQGNVNELLGLCSGQFSGAFTTGGSSDTNSNTQNTAPPLFRMDSGASEDVSSTQGGMNELLGLCSGTFNVIPMQPKSAAYGQEEERQKTERVQKKQLVKRHKRLVVASDSEDEDVNDSRVSFTIGSGSENGDSDTNVNLDSDEDVPDDDKENMDSPHFKGFNSRKAKGIRQEFVEDEAELSGSEVESDDDQDIDANEDILETEEGDKDNVGTEEQLRNQVGRVHLKTMLDEDDKEVRLMKEMYLPDGDLHSDATGRLRRFKWAHVDDEDTQQDLFHSDEEAVDEDTAVDEQWRAKRFEREQYLEEQNAKESEENADDSQLLKLGKVIFKQKTGNMPVVPPSPTQVEKVVAKPKTPSKLFKKPTLTSCGSFLGRSKEALAKIAQLSKPVGSTVGGARSSNKFVFHSVDSAAVASKETRPQLKRANSEVSHPAKRQRVDRSNSIPSSSIFNHM